MSKAADELKEGMRIWHEARVRQYLTGKNVRYNAIWLSVGYFSDGAGRTYLNEKRPFTNEEWRKLLETTSRSTDDHYLK